MISKNEARALVRKAVKRVPEGEEIRHLNIMPMMDMMTILLVAMIFQASNSAAMEINDVELPASKSYEELPESSIRVTVAKEGILVDGTAIVAVKNGAVDASEKKDGALGLQITALSRTLGGLRAVYASKQLAAGKIKKGDAAIPELFIIADKVTPYRLLFEVIASARAEEAGYRRFRLIVLDRGESGASAPE